MPKDDIIIVTQELEDSSRSALPSIGAHRPLRSVAVASETVRSNIEQFISQFGPLLDERSQQTRGYVLDEIELSLAVTAKGGVELIGKMEAGAEASIKVKLKRRE